MWKDTIRKTDILKKDYDITWAEVNIDNYDFSNIPKEWIRKEGEKWQDAVKRASAMLKKK